MLRDGLGSVDQLGAQNCFALGSLLFAHASRLAVAPTRKVTTQMMHRLCNAGVIATPWPDAQWKGQQQANTTPIERLEWAYTWRASTLSELPEHLFKFLSKLRRTTQGRENCVAIWKEIAVAEAQSFFKEQLVKHHFDGEWADDIEYAFHSAPDSLSIAQWRYCGWAAVRHGASFSQQHGSQLSREALREAIYKELLKRARYVRSPGYSKCKLAPFDPLPRNAAGQLVQAMSGLGAAFWSERPSQSAVRYKA
jgi:hypothetical protein